MPIMSVVGSKMDVTQAPNLFSKRQLRPRKDADRYVHVFGCCEPARARTKIARGELIANFGRPRFDAVETVVTHLGTPLFGKAPQPTQAYSFLCPHASAK